MTPRRLRSVAAALAVALLLATGTTEARGESQTWFEGLDGLKYPWAPPVVAGGDGYFFMGGDFDASCGNGDKFQRTMKHLSRLTDVIEKSGRRVILTIAPNKSSVLPQLIDRSSIPHGQCSDVGLGLEDKILDHYRDPNYLPLRRALAASPRQVYWRTDLHWSTVGGAVFAKTLASRLSKKVGRKQRYSYSSETGLGILNKLRGDPTQETLQHADPASGVSVRTAPGAPDWAGYPTLTYDHSWDSSPAAKTFPGHTLLLGDSFTMFALQNLRPVFRHGRFMWFAHTNTADIVSAVAASDTVVIEIVQLFTVGSEIATPSFRHAVAAALRSR